ncbi:MAG: aromatic ring-hydroxylating dioxygenase subunit alpha [Albidovulum sp.]
MSQHNPPRSPLLDHCPASLPKRFYRDPEWFRNEMRAIWANNWIYIGRVTDIEPGTMRRKEVAGQNLILCRDAVGSVTAFHNTCRHRGAEVCSVDAKPMGKLITCPYHAWAYGTDGRLVSVAHATPTADFRKEDHGLFPVHLHVWNGFLYLCLADHPPEFKPDLGILALDNWPMADLITGHSLVKDLACNWKIFWENYNECLHCPGIHPELSDMVPVYRKGIMAANEAPDWVPGADPQTLKDDAKTWTMTGAPCGPEFPDLSPDQRANGSNFVTLYPSVFVVAHVDYVRAVSLTPLSPERTRLTAEWFFAPETLAQPGFDAADVAEFATIVLNQDANACEMNQRGLSSDRFRQGRLMPQEFDIHHFHTWVLSQMGMTPGEIS